LTSDPPPPDSYAFHLKTYGCQMNVSDSEVVRSIMLSSPQPRFHEVTEEALADVSLTNTCAIRDNAEKKVWNRAYQLRAASKKAKRKQVVALLGCMSERIKSDIFSDSKASVDVVCGPDAYRGLPGLLASALEEGGPASRGCDTQLSFTETYADVVPRRGDKDAVDAYVSVMRGCNNMCSYCVVPFTRGRERSKALADVVEECKRLIFDSGVREVTLLGQNVNSYHDRTAGGGKYDVSNDGFTNLYRLRGGEGLFFADLVEAVSDIDDQVRVRFTSPHPKDFPPHLLQLVGDRPNVCSSLHLPAQSGSDSVLERMRRGYTYDSYMRLVSDARSAVPGVSLSSDFIAGFCGETEEEHSDTIRLMREVEYDQAFMFAYSMRGKTHAHRRMEDDVPDDVKQRRLEEVIETFRSRVQLKNEREELGSERVVLVEGEARRGRGDDAVMMTGRTDGNKRVLFPRVEAAKGEYVKVTIDEVRGHTLRGVEVGLCDIEGNMSH